MKIWNTSSLVADRLTPVRQLISDALKRQNVRDTVLRVEQPAAKKHVFHISMVMLFSFLDFEKFSVNTRDLEKFSATSFSPARPGRHF